MAELGLARSSSFQLQSSFIALWHSTAELFFARPMEPCIENPAAECRSAMEPITGIRKAMDCSCSLLDVETAPDAVHLADAWATVFGDLRRGAPEPGRRVGLACESEQQHVVTPVRNTALLQLDQGNT